MPTGGWMGVIGGVLGFVAFAIAHVLGSRAGAPNARLLGLAFPLSTLCGAVLAVALAIAFGMSASIALAAILALLVTGSLFVLYAPALYVVLTSQSVEILIWLHVQGRYAPETAAYDRFASRAVVEDRLATLEGSLYLLRDGEILRLTARGRSIASMFKAIGNLWKLGAGG